MVRVNQVEEVTVGLEQLLEVSVGQLHDCGPARLVKRLCGPLDCQAVGVNALMDLVRQGVNGLLQLATQSGADVFISDTEFRRLVARGKVRKPDTDER